jgi:hypothetical protein
VENVEKFNRGFSMVKANSSINNYENTTGERTGPCFTFWFQPTQYLTPTEIF